MTENDGGKWTELTQNLPEADARPMDRADRTRARRMPKVAYVATNAYRAGDDRPMIVRTADLGQDLAKRRRRRLAALTIQSKWCAKIR